MSSDFELRLRVATEFLHSPTFSRDSNALGHRGLATRAFLPFPFIYNCKEAIHFHSFSSHRQTCRIEAFECSSRTDRSRRLCSASVRCTLVCARIDKESSWVAYCGELGVYFKAISEPLSGQVGSDRAASGLSQRSEISVALDVPDSFTERERLGIPQQQLGVLERCAA